MSAKSERYFEVAQDLADRFEAMGDKFSAEQARKLGRVITGYALTLSQLHKDNVELRNRVGEFCPFCEMRVSSEEKVACRKSDCALRALDRLSEAA
jgi:hypothetical protein